MKVNDKVGILIPTFSRETKQFVVGELCVIKKRWPLRTKYLVRYKHTTVDNKGKNLYTELLAVWTTEIFPVTFVDKKKPKDKKK